MGRAAGAVRRAAGCALGGVLLAALLASCGRDAAGPNLDGVDLAVRIVPRDQAQPGVLQQQGWRYDSVAVSAFEMSAAAGEFLRARAVALLDSGVTHFSLRLFVPPAARYRLQADVFGASQTAASAMLLAGEAFLDDVAGESERSATILLDPVGTIEGAVFDMYEAPFEGVLVRLYAEGTEMPMRAVYTQAEGEFSLLRVPEGLYYFEVSAPGCQSYFWPPQVAFQVVAGSVSPAFIYYRCSVPMSTEASGRNGSFRPRARRPRADEEDSCRHGA